jgi:hypothetical protein
MPLQYLETIKQDPQNKDHKKLLEVLYGILAVCFIVWMIVYVQVKSVVTENIVEKIMTNSNLTDVERAQIILSLKEATANTPPLTSNERVKIVQNLKKQAQVSSLTDEQRLKIINDLKNKI